ncbi:MAG: CAP domain-containing protein [Bacteroidota bacterium]
MKLANYFTFLFVCAIHFSFGQITVAGFRSGQIDSASVNLKQSVLSVEEKKVIVHLNLARMYPKQYSKNVVVKYDEKKLGYAFGPEYGKAKSKLIKQLNEMNPLAPLQLDSSLYEVAKCWANESGKLGKVATGRVYCKGGYSSECCSYGFNKAVDIVMQMLVDYNDPNAGHRNIIFTPYFNKIGVKIAVHKTYKHTCVMDFK